MSYLDDIERHGFAVFEDFIDHDSLEHLLQELANARIDNQAHISMAAWTHVRFSTGNTTANGGVQKPWAYGNSASSSSLITCRA